MAEAEPAKPARQILVCASAEQAERGAALFPALEARYLNGGDWAQLEGRRCVCLGDALAAFAFGYASETKVLPDDLPADLTAETALAWAKAHARLYDAQQQDQPNAAQREPSSSPELVGAGTAQAVAKDAGAVPPSVTPPTPAVAAPDYPTPDPVGWTAPEAPTGDAAPPDDYVPLDAYENEPSARSAVWEPSGDGWPIPVDFWGGETSMLPLLDPDMLPGWLHDYVADQSGLRGVDPVQPALQCLLAFSGAMHNSHGIRPKAGEIDYIERPVLWGATVGNPSTKKDAGQAIALGPLFPLDVEMRRKTALAMQDRADQDHRYQEDLLAWRKGKQVGERPQPPAPVMMDRLFVDNFTLEGMRGVLEHNSRGKVLVAVSELAGVFGNADAFTNNKGASKDMPMLLRLYESKSMIVDRAPPAPPVFVKSWAASVAGAIQPLIFARVVQKMHLTEDGMLARFLLVVSKNATAGEDRPADRAAADNYKRVMALLCAMHAGAEPCTLSRGAAEIRAQFLAWVYRMAGAGVLSDGLAAAVGKFEGSFARLCLVMHAAECAQAALPVIAPEVSEATAERVRALILGLLYPHAAKFYADLNTETNYLKIPALIAAYILHEGARELTATMLWRGLSSWRHMDKRLRDDALRTCCEAGWLRKRGETVYAVNPDVHTMFAAARDKEVERRARLTVLMQEKMGPRARTPGED